MADVNPLTTNKETTLQLSLAIKTQAMHFPSPLMTRRQFLHSSAAFAGYCFLNSPLSASADYDLILAGGRVVDGSGAPSFEADVAIKGNRIAAIGPALHGRAHRIIDVRGLAVAPGFIDIHSHSDITLLDDGRAMSKVMQGVTTEIVGMDGRSVAPLNDLSVEYFQAHYGRRPLWRDFDGYFRALRYSGISVNVGSMVGAATLRFGVAGMESRPVTPSEMVAMKSMFRGAQLQGGNGLSTGLEYYPGAYASTQELSDLSKGAGVYVTHMRSEENRVLEALGEAIDIGRRSGSPIHISHLKAQGRRNQPLSPLLLQAMDRARERGLTITCDRYPFTAYSNRIESLLPAWVRGEGRDGLKDVVNDPQNRESLKIAVENKVASIGSWQDIQIAYLPSTRLKGWVGRRIGEIARKERREPFSVIETLVHEHSISGSMVVFAMAEAEVERLLRYPYCAIASDGAAMSVKAGGRPHPRNFGTYPLVLQHYVRERGLISLEEAVRKMSRLPASIMKIRERGLIREGYFADLTVFCPENIQNLSTYDHPLCYPKGIEYVIVNGKVVVENGEHNGETPGRAL